MKKTITVFLLTVLLLLTAGCGGEDRQNVFVYEKTETETNFYGAKMIISDQNHNGTYVLIPHAGDNSISDLMLDRYNEVERKLNCTVDVIEGLYTEIPVYAAVGEKYCDLANIKASHAHTLLQSDMLFDCTLLEGTDMHSGKYGKESYLKLLSTGNEIYTFVAEYWGIPSPYICNSLLYNPRIIKEKQLTDPHEYAEQKEWTWDNFQPMCEAAADITSDPENPFYAAPFNNYFTQAALFSNGAEYVTRNENTEKYECSILSPEATNAINWLRELKLKDDVFDLILDGWETACNDFAAGKYLFLAEYSWVGLSKDGGRVGVNMKEPFSWIYYPRGPQGNYDSYATISTSNDVFVVPVTAETENVGYLLEELFMPLYDTEYGWRDKMSLDVFFDSESEKYYYEMLDTAVPDYTHILGSTMSSAFNKALNLSNSASEILTGAYESIQTIIDTELNK